MPQRLNAALELSHAAPQVMDKSKTMSEDNEKVRELGITIVKSASPEQLSVLEAWAKRMLEIRNSPMSRVLKAKAAIQSTIELKAITPILALSATEIKRVGWDERGYVAKWTIGAAIASLTLTGQGAGIAALGGAIGVPLFVVFGAGGALAGTIIQEISKARSSKSGAGKSR